MRSNRMPEGLSPEAEALYKDTLDAIFYDGPAQIKALVAEIEGGSLEGKGFTEEIIADLAKRARIAAADNRYLAQ